MAITRSAVLFAKDAGRWLVVEDTGMQLAAETWVDVKAATRYTNLASFTGIVPTTSFKQNRFGDGDKVLNDAAYGFEVRDKFFTDPGNIPPDINNNTPNVAGGTRLPNTIARTTIIFSYDTGKYLWIQPDTRSYPPQDMKFAWVNNPHEASRFTNIAEWENIMDNTELGRVTYGYALRQYVFTKDPFDPGYVSPFFVSGVKNTFSQTRAYIPYSQEVGRYLWIDPATRTGPIANMRFSWVSNPWQGARFTNLVEFRNIVNDRPDFFLKTWLAKSWETPQFYFTQVARVKGKPKFQVLFENPQGCGQSYWLPQPKAGINNTYQYFRQLAVGEFRAKFSREDEENDIWAQYTNQEVAQQFLGHLIEQWGLFSGINTVSDPKWYNEEYWYQQAVERAIVLYGKNWKQQLEENGTTLRALLPVSMGCYANLFKGRSRGISFAVSDEGNPVRAEIEEDIKSGTSWTVEDVSQWVTNVLWREANGLTALLTGEEGKEGGNGGNFEDEPAWQPDPLEIQLFLSGNNETCGYLTRVKEYQQTYPGITSTASFIAAFASIKFAPEYFGYSWGDAYDAYSKYMMFEILGNYDAGWVSRDCYWKWWDNQDKTLVQQWLYDIYTQEIGPDPSRG